MKAKLLVFLAAAMLAMPLLIASSSSASAYDSYPCGPQYYQPWAAEWPLLFGTSRVQDCPLWRGNVPLYALPGAPEVVGHLNSANGNWFWCQHQLPVTGEYHYGPYANDWWAATVSDPPYVNGWVPEVFFKGGNNNEPDATLRHC